MKTLHILKYFYFVILTSTLLSSCTKDESIKLPIVTTELIVTNITATSAQSGGSTTNNNKLVNARGVCWSTSNNPTIKDSLTKDTQETEAYVSQMHHLFPNTQYFVRAYATNRFGTAYGDIISFKTLVDFVTLSTTDISAITSTTATGGGTITNDGNGVILERGVCWNTMPNPTILNYKTSDGNGKGSYISNIIGLIRNTTYYVRAYAKNEVKISYGSQVTFNTVAELPTVTTTTPINIGESSTQLGGNVIDNGSIELIAKGICYSTNHNPTLFDSHTNSGTTAGEWATILTGISPLTTYYIRAYATNSMGTSFGGEIAFTTLAKPHSAGTVTDIDGNVYKTITIGNQTWMAENLKTSKYNDGSVIPYITDFELWRHAGTPAYCWPNNDIAYKETYGALYNWYTVTRAKLAPTGWHVASINEWGTLKTYLMNNNYYVDNSTSKIAKSMVSKFGWNNSTTTSAVGNDMTINNSSGFNAVPSGMRNPYRDFTPIGIATYWWTPDMSYNTTASYAYNISLFYDDSLLEVSDLDLPQTGFSVRCIKD